MPAAEEPEYEQVSGRYAQYYFEAWTAKLAQENLLHEALKHSEIVDAMRREELHYHQVFAAMSEDENVLAQLLREQEKHAGEASEPSIFDGASASGLIRVGFAFAFAAGYLSLVRFAWPSLPMPWLFVLLTVIPVLVVATRQIFQALPALRDRFDWQADETLEPHEQQFALGHSRPVILREFVLRAVGDHINEHRKRRYGTVLEFSADVGLYDENNTEFVRTRGVRQLRRILERSDSGAVALAGNRGVGKTTAIAAMGKESFAGSRPPLTIVASAPAHYEARDFVLHLHALLCRSVIDKVRESLGYQRNDPPQRLWLIRLSRRFRAVVRLLAYLAAALAVTMLFWGSGTKFFAEIGPALNTAIAGLPGSLLTLSWNRAVAAGILALTMLNLLTSAGSALRKAIAGRIRAKRTAGLADLLSRATTDLRQIRFLQTYTTGWSGKLSMPLKSEATQNWSRQSAEQQLTHPEVVAKFREFAATAAASLREHGVTDRLVIAVDELDKIGEPEKAHQFVNDVKGVFGVPGCLFFVSVSDDAILNFEQRGLAVRDAFDSAFSEMVRLEHFSITESTLWMSRCLPGISEQFSVLCHCLSGGLPRDLRRCAVEMVDVTSHTYRPSLSDVAAELVERELTGKLHAFSGMISALEPSEESSALLTELTGIRQVEDPLELANLAAGLIQDTPATSTPAGRLRQHSAAFVLFCATVLELFRDDMDEDDLDEDFATLALARRQMPMHPDTAWLLLLDFRKSRDLTLPGG